MRYKVLITGRNDSAITAFFEQMTEDFVVLSTSTRYEDIIGHIDYFAPDIFVYCLLEEKRDSIVQMLSINSRLMRSGTPCIILGSKEDCDEFERVAVDVASLVLHRPISAPAIHEKILNFMEKRPSSSSSNANGVLTGMEGLPPIPEVDVDQLLSSLPGGEAIVQHKKHILVVDDNAMMLKVIKEHLHEKYDVATAVSGKVALKFLERKRTDLILLDYDMPQENGPAVLEKLRASEATRNIPVIFLTGVTDRKKIKQALILKPQGYLLKPVERDKLLEEIEKVIG